MIRNRLVSHLHFRRRGLSFAMLFAAVCGPNLSAEPSGDPDMAVFHPGTAEVLRSLHRDADGIPSRDEFLRRHGIEPRERKVRLRPRFVVTWAREDWHTGEGSGRPSDGATPLGIDFSLETVSSHVARNRAEPIHDGRVYEEGGEVIIGAYSSRMNERPVGKIASDGTFKRTVAPERAAEFPLLNIPDAEILFDPFEWRLLRVTPAGGARIDATTRSWLPLAAESASGLPMDGITWGLEFVPDEKLIVLTAAAGGRSIRVAQCSPSSAPVSEIRPGFRPELGRGCVQAGTGATIRCTFEGELTELVRTRDGRLTLPDGFADAPSEGRARAARSASVTIDGDFSDWRNIEGTPDPLGDHVSYLYPNPDTDLLEMKVTSDAEHIYFYSRVAGAHGRTGEKGRYYWYSYIDADADPATGYPPTRDDNCYFGVAIGDDCESQFEFIGNRFIKTFFGFTGAGAEKEALSGALTLGPSFYSSKDVAGNKRDRYKVEYVHVDGERRITHDYTEGSSEDIIIGLSADGSEMEMRAAFAGFLKDRSGRPLLAPGRTIHLAIGAEASSDFYGGREWGADSTRPIYGYRIGGAGAD